MKTLIFLIGMILSSVVYADTTCQFTVTGTIAGSYHPYNIMIKDQNGIYSRQISITELNSLRKFCQEI